MKGRSDQLHVNVVVADLTDGTDGVVEVDLVAAGLLLTVVARVVGRENQSVVDEDVPTAPL